MDRHVAHRRRALIASFVAASGCTVAATLAPSAQPVRAQAVSCFVVAGTMNCIEGADVMPIMPMVPPIFISSGPGGEGENEHYVIEDNGGREIARG